MIGEKELLLNLPETRFPMILEITDYRSSFRISDRSEILIIIKMISPVVKFSLEAQGWTEDLFKDKA